MPDGERKSDGEEAGDARSAAPLGMGWGYLLTWLIECLM